MFSFISFYVCCSFRFVWCMCDTTRVFVCSYKSGFVLKIHLISELHHECSRTSCRTSRRTKEANNTNNTNKCNFLSPCLRTMRLELKILPCRLFQYVKRVCFSSGTVSKYFIWNISSALLLELRGKKVWKNDETRYDGRKFRTEIVSDSLRTLVWMWARVIS